MSLLNPSAGGVIIGVLVADFRAFTLAATQDVQPVTAYDGAINVPNIGSGTPEMSATVNGAAEGGAANTALNMPTPSISAAATFTLDTGVTESCNVSVSKIQAASYCGHVNGVIVLNFSMKSIGEITEMWATA